MTSHSIEPVGQAVGVRPDKRCRQITSRGCRCHWNAEAGVQYSTAGKSVVWDEGRRLLVSKDTKGKLMTIESRQAEEQQWVCFGPGRAFTYKMETGRVIPFESTPNGRNLTLELEAPNDANIKLQEIMDIMMTGKRLEQTEKIEHMGALPHVFKQMLTGRQDVSSLQPLFGWQGTDL